VILHLLSDSSGDSNNNNFTGNTITTSTNESTGIRIEGTNFTNITQNTIKVTGNKSHAISFVHIADNIPANNTIWNNIFNSTDRHVNVTAASPNINNLSVDLVSVTNVIGGANIGGNYYDNSTDGGEQAFSLTCVDTNGDGICDAALTHASNTIDFYPLAVEDTIPPENSIINPTRNANVSGNFLINATINDSSNIDFVNLTIFNITSNATAIIPMTLGSGAITAGNWNATFDSTALTDGFYNLSVNATDSLGNTNISENLSITIDNTGPNVTMVTPLNGTVVAGSILINATVNDSLTKVFNVTFKLYNSTDSVTDWLYAELNSGDTTNGFWNATFDTTTVNDSVYNITVNATDYAGNSVVVNITT